MESCAQTLTVSSQLQAAAQVHVIKPSFLPLWLGVCAVLNAVLPCIAAGVLPAPTGAASQG